MIGRGGPNDAMKRKIPLTSRRSHQPSDAPLVALWVYSRYGDVTPVQFCIDTGADRCALPASLAVREGIEFPRTESARVSVGGLVGSASAYRGSLRVRALGEDFTWPCEFVENTGQSVQRYGVLGRAGFLEDFHFCLRKPYFTLQRRHNSLLRRLSAALTPWAARHAADEPL